MDHLKTAVDQLFSSAIKNYNQTVSPERILLDSNDTVLFGLDSKLDSLGFINFVVALEAEIESQFNVSLIIVDEESLGMAESPFKTIQTLKNLVQTRIKESGANSK